MANKIISGSGLIVVNNTHGLCVCEGKFLVPIDGYNCDTEELYNRHTDKGELDLELYCSVTEPYQKVEGVLVRMHVNK